MMGETIALRAALPSDAERLAELVNYAGEGLPLYLWSKMAEPGQDAWDVGHQRARRDEGSFSWRNAIIAELDDEVAGCLVGYAIPTEPEPIDPDLPAMFVPLQELENFAPDTWYVNVLATLPRCRGRGVGSHLVEHAADIARSEGLLGLSLIVSDANEGARRLYERLGFMETATRPMVKEDWENEGENWVLMVRSL